MNILYVEDNTDLRETIGEMLTGPGRSVHCCADAEQALAAFSAAPFDVVLTDVSLPGMSGTDLVRKLLVSRPLLHVVLCSGYDFGKHAQVLGPNVQSLAKPFELDTLDDLLARIATELTAARGGPTVAP